MCFTSGFRCILDVHNFVGLTTAHFVALIFNRSRIIGIIEGGGLWRCTRSRRAGTHSRGAVVVVRVRVTLERATDCVVRLMKIRRPLIQSDGGRLSVGRLSCHGGITHALGRVVGGRITRVRSAARSSSSSRRSLTDVRLERLIGISGVGTGTVSTGTATAPELFLVLLLLQLLLLLLLLHVFGVHVVRRGGHRVVVHVRIVGGGGGGGAVEVELILQRRTNCLHCWVPTTGGLRLLCAF